MQHTHFKMSVFLDPIMKNRDSIARYLPPKHGTNIELRILTDEVERPFQRILRAYCVSDHNKI